MLIDFEKNYRVNSAMFFFFLNECMWKKIDICLLLSLPTSKEKKEKNAVLCLQASHLPGLSKHIFRHFQKSPRPNIWERHRTISVIWHITNPITRKWTKNTHSGINKEYAQNTRKCKTNTEIYIYIYLYFLEYTKAFDKVWQN